MAARRFAYTLIEVLVVVVIMAILMGLLLPTVQAARESSRRASCLNNQHQLATAVLNFEQVKKRLPGYNALQAVDATGVQRPASWIFSLLPFLENQDIYDEHGPLGSPGSRGQAPNAELTGLVCPSDDYADAKGDGTDRTATSYVANCGQVDVIVAHQLPPDWRANGVFMHLFPCDDQGNALRTESLTLSFIAGGDGTSRTLMLSENVDAGFWTATGEADIGFVWEATLADGRPLPTALAGINERTGERWRRQVASREAPWQYAAAHPGIACVSCGPSVPLLPRNPPLSPFPLGNPNPDDPLADPIDPQPLIDQAHQSLRFARPSSRHPGGVVVTFVDGRSDFLSEEVDYVAYCQLMASCDAKATLAGKIDPVPDAYLHASPLP